MSERATNDTRNVEVIAGYLVIPVDNCTCDGGGEFPHRPECGYEPAVPIAEVEAALARAGRPVVELPEREPDPPNGWRVPTWNYDRWQVQAFDDDQYPISLTSDGKGYGLDGDLAEALALRLLAAVQHHRQRRAGPAGGSLVGEQHDQ